MKKIILGLAALIMMLAACNTRNEQGTAANDTAQSEAPAASESQDNGGWLKQTTIRTEKPMVVDFYATWCGPCKQLAPILDEIEQNHKGEVIFKRIDVDQEPDLAAEFNIEAIPLLMFITPAGEYQTLMGLQDPEVIEAKIKELLARSGSAA